MTISRRRFLATSAAAIGTAALVKPRRVSANSKVNIAAIGVGGMGMVHLDYQGARLLAVCDVDEDHLKRAMKIAGPGVAGYKDFREVLERSDIDIVHIPTPPHWHALISVAAAEAGKDIWCEKPMTRTIGEGPKVVEAVPENGRIFRLSTGFRFRSRYYGFGTTVRPIKKIVQNGLLGWPLKVTLSGVTGFNWKFHWFGKHNLKPQSPPKVLDYDMWLGPAPYKPYHPHRVHNSFRGYWDYDGGGLGDMGMHYLDPVQYILDKDNTSPVEIEADCPQQHPDACGSWRRIRLVYSDGCEIILDGENVDKNAPFIEGPEGMLFKGLESNILGLKEKLATLPDPEPQMTDFFESVRTRKKFTLNEENGHRTCTIVNLSKIAVRLGRALRFDPDKQRFVGDEEANRFIHQPMRAPWQI